MATKKKPGGAARKEADVARNEQVVRILRVLRDLDRSGGCDLYELAERHGATTRTIRRDLEALQEAGFPLSRESSGDSARVRWQIDTEAAERITRLVDASHYLALKVAMEASHTLKKSSLFHTLEDIAKKVEAAIGAKGRDQLLEFERAFLSWEKFAWRQAPPDVVWQLVDAIAGQRLCRVTYRAPSSGNKDRKFPVLPLRLLVHNGTLYVHAWQSHFKTVLLLNLQRLKSLEVLEEREALPPDYDPARLERSAFGIFLGREVQRFELEFDAWALPYIEERQWHPEQTLTPLPDGGARLVFECTPSFEVTNWVASWQEHVRVLAPARLRGDLKKYGAWLLEQYG